MYALYVDENIKNKAEQFKREGYKNFERVKVLDITPRIIEVVKKFIGFDATGYQIYSNTNTYKHIEDGQPSKMIKFTKEIEGKQYVVIAAPENKYKKLWVISEYRE